MENCEITNFDMIKTTSKEVVAHLLTATTMPYCDVGKCKHTICNEYECALQWLNRKVIEDDN